MILIIDVIRMNVYVYSVYAFDTGDNGNVIEFVKAAVGLPAAPLLKLSCLGSKQFIKQYNLSPFLFMILHFLIIYLFF